MRNNRTEEKAGKDPQGERESDGKVEDGRRGKGGTIWEKVRGRIAMETFCLTAWRTLLLRAVHTHAALCCAREWLNVFQR